MGQNTLKNNIIYQDELITKLELKSKVYGNKELLIDTIDFNRVKMFCWYPHVAKTYNTFYARAKIPGTTSSIYIHRLIMSFPDKDIDHINRNGLINTKSNLREVTISENMGNKIQCFKKNSKTKGVVFRFDGRKNPYTAQINGKHIGSYKTAEEAARAYDLAAIKYFKEFALTNFPKEDYL